MTRNQKFELVGGLFGAAIAYGGVALGIAVGWFRLGFILLVVTVPAGVILGWLLAKLMSFTADVLNE